MSSYSARSRSSTPWSGSGTSALDVVGGERQVGLDEGHLDVGEEVAEERPLRVHLAERVVEAGLAGGRQPAAHAEPARHDLAGLGPAEHPRDRAQAVEPAVRVRAAGGARSEVQLAEQLDRGRGAVVGGRGLGRRPGPVARARRPRRSASIDSVPRRSASPPACAGACAARSPRAPRPASAPGSRVRGSGSRYLSEITSPCSVSLISPSSVRGGWARIASWVGPAAAADRAAAAVEQPQPDAVAPADVAQAPLGAMDLPLATW